MRVTIDEARQHCVVPEVDDLRLGRCSVGHGLDSIPTNHHDTVVEHIPGPRFQNSRGLEGDRHVGLPVMAVGHKRAS